MKKLTKLLIGTSNPGKVGELLSILAESPFELVTPRQIGLTLEVEETGTTYAANARLKATAFARASGLLTLADDSGLEVDALGGEPGVYSARYAGKGAGDAERRAKLIATLRDVPPPRTARFRCVLAIADPQESEPADPLSPPALALYFFEGTCEGEIVLEERGSGGFGYDPIFFVPEYGCTLAELPEEVKNRISHRARAAQAALPFLRSLLRSRLARGR
ncbi:MAG: RdgB/HAM1 family non-canonical purine NTP pyrophosphatase [Anaerolineales bacterium]|nr:RdgB/HAM1 family non-canonical purine NTP pyrophosphatase [Anaerolineales bacterium]